MRPHLDEAQKRWKTFIQPGDTVIDATVGNGYDTLYLAQLLKGQGRLVGYDVQELAIEEAKKRLKTLPDSFSRTITLKLKSHVQLDEENVKLIVYNLGYLPGGDKTITTLCDTTLASISHALTKLRPDGALSITCYPGHDEGVREHASLVEFLKTLSPHSWVVCHHQWINRPLSATWIWLQSVQGA